MWQHPIPPGLCSGWHLPGDTWLTGNTMNWKRINPKASPRKALLSYNMLQKFHFQNFRPRGSMWWPVVIFRVRVLVWGITFPDNHADCLEHNVARWSLPYLRAAGCHGLPPTPPAPCNPGLGWWWRSGWLTLYLSGFHQHPGIRSKMRGS